MARNTYIPLSGCRFHGEPVYLLKNSRSVMLAEKVPHEAPRTDLWDIVLRLREYEALGLTPCQIREMDKLYLEKCKELNRMKDALERLLQKLQYSCNREAPSSQGEGYTPQKCDAVTMEQEGEHEEY